MILRRTITTRAPAAHPKEPRLNPNRRWILSLAVLLLPALARADRRYYGETYNAATAAPGGLDIETWSTLHAAPPGTGGPHLWQNQLELETGITDRWDVALYNVWDVPQSEATRYSQTKVEMRYRLTRPGDWFVDPIAYLEVKKEWTEDKPIGVEGKLIVGKDIGPVNVSLNGSVEQEFIPGGGRASEYGYALGTSYELAPWLRAGAEVFGFQQRAVGATVTTHYAGPALSFAWSRFWLVTALGMGLNDAAERVRATAVFAVQL
jgi:hypothetical protein